MIEYTLWKPLIPGWNYDLEEEEDDDETMSFSVDDSKRDKNLVKIFEERLRGRLVRVESC